MDQFVGFGLLLFLFFLFADIGVSVSPRMAFVGGLEREDWPVLMGCGGGVSDQPPHLRYRKLGIGDMRMESDHVTQGWVAGDGDTEKPYWISKVDAKWASGGSDRTWLVALTWSRVGGGNSRWRYDLRMAFLLVAMSDDGVRDGFGFPAASVLGFGANFGAEDGCGNGGGAIAGNGRDDSGIGSGGGYWCTGASHAQAWSDWALTGL